MITAVHQGRGEGSPATHSVYNRCARWATEAKSGPCLDWVAAVLISFMGQPSVAPGHGMAWLEYGGGAAEAGLEHFAHRTGHEHLSVVQPDRAVAELLD